MKLKIAHMSQNWEMHPETVTSVSIKATVSGLRIALPKDGSLV
jgi:hypothetical protein